MQIIVTTSTAKLTFEDTTGYEVDDQGRLHILDKTEGPLATFAAYNWLNVQREPQPAVEPLPAKAAKAVGPRT